MNRTLHKDHKIIKGSRGLICALERALRAMQITPTASNHHHVAQHVNVYHCDVNVYRCKHQFVYNGVVSCKAKTTSTSFRITM